MKFFHTYHAYSFTRASKRNKYEKKYHSLIEKNKSKHILVILHLFYPESWKEIREYLLNLREYQWDLVITVPHDRLDLIDKKSILELNERTTFLSYENKGFDIGPFLMAIKEIPFQNYDVVFKIQSKGVKRKRIFIYRQIFLNRDWFLNLFEGVLGAKGVHLVIDKIANDPDINLAGAENLLVHDPAHKERLVSKVLQEHGRKSTEPGYYFLAGSCFAVKPSCLTYFAEMPLSLDDFTVVPSSRGMSYAHAMERELCFHALPSREAFWGNPVCGVRRALKKPAEAMLRRVSSERLHKEPFVIDDEFFLWKLDNRLILYKIKPVKLRKLQYEGKMNGKLVRLPLEKAYPYRYLNGDEKAYEEYCKIHADQGYPLMTHARFDALIQSVKENGYDEKNIIMIKEEKIIMDGQHRACCMAYLYGLETKIKVLQISHLTAMGIIKKITPQFLLNIYYKKRYGI